jgi:hypothetical protein
MIWVANGQPLNDANEEVPMVTQLDEKGDACKKWPRSIFKKHRNGTRILQTSLDVR